MIDFKQLAQQYKSELLDRVMPFWMEKSIDKEFGGYFTCLAGGGCAAPAPFSPSSSYIIKNRPE